MREKRDRKGLDGSHGEHGETSAVCAAREPGIRESAVQGIGRGGPWLTRTEPWLQLDGGDACRFYEPLGSLRRLGQSSRRLAASPASTYAPRLPYPGQCSTAEERKSEDVEGQSSIED